jgi:predicted nuclease of predicted toxin-antitoxin system
MPIRYYMDHHIHAAVTLAPQTRGIDCLTAEADSHRAAPDDILLHRATELDPVLVTHDTDLLEIGK